MLTDTTAPPPSPKLNRIPGFAPGPISSIWGMIAAFSALLVSIVALSQPDDSLSWSASAAAIALTLAFGRRLSAAHRSDPRQEIAVITALAMTATFEIGVIWLELERAPWPPPAWLCWTLIVAAGCWFGACASRFRRSDVLLPLIESALPGSMLAFAAIYSIPNPSWMALRANSTIWILTTLAIALGLASCSLSPDSPPILLAGFGGAAVPLGVLGGVELAVVLGNLAFAGAGIAAMRGPRQLSHRSPRIRRTLNNVDILLAPALVFLVIAAIVLRGSVTPERRLAMHACAGVALSLLIARHVLLLWGQRRDIGSLETSRALLVERASIDDLTRLPNRHALLSRINEELERARRYDQPLSLCFVDIDFFKTVNDRFGHAMGDRTLISIAGTIRRTARSIDFVGRYGGEEFLVVAPGTRLDEAVRLAERIRVAVEDAAIQTAEGGRFRLTVSVGLAEYPSNALSVPALIDAADGALYISKRSGRNRVSSPIIPSAT